MALNIPTKASQVVSRMRVDIQRELPGLNPFLKNSWIGAIVTSLANRVFDFYFALTRAQLEAIPNTTILFLEKWASVWKILRLPATKSTGRLALTGDTSGAIAVGGSTWRSTSGNQYISTSAGSITLQSLAVASITRIGSVATLTTVNNHFLASNVTISVTGAGESEYNVVDSVMTVTGDKILTFTVTGTPATPATGTILLAFTSLSVTVQAVDFGIDKTQLFDELLTLQSPLFQVDDNAGVGFGGISGGTDQEENPELRNRMLDRIQNPIAHFNVSEIIAVSKAIAGVTRVFVQQITPAVGQVTIHFMRDDDTNPIPDANEVLAVKDAIDNITPANTDTLDVIVLAPTPIIQVFTFTAISPDTPTMRTAIETSLKAFFAEKTEVGVNIVEEAYNAAIFNTVDLTNGDLLLSFTLTVPAADITIAAGEIGQLGTVSF